MAEFGLLGFAIAALLYLLFSLLLLTSWRGRLQGGLMLTATLVSTLWATVFALQSGYRMFPLNVIWGAEALRNIAWCAFLVSLLLKMAKQRDAPERLYQLMGGVVVVASLMLLIPDEVVPLGIFLDLRYLGEVVVAVIGMMMVEQVYRNTLQEQRWAIKYLCLGLGGMFAFDFYLFSDALLFKRIDANLWYARGGISSLIVPLLAVSAARNPDWSLDLFVSRRVVFHTTTLLSAGIYMLLMAFAGYYIKLYGGEWGTVLQITFLFAAVLLLATLLFSGQVRAQARVFFNKHFFNYRYDYREEWLRLIGLLSGQDTDIPLLERVIWALGEIVDSAGGILWLCSDRSECQPVAQWNQPLPSIDEDPALDSLVAFLKQRQWIINLQEYQSDREFYGDLEIPQWLKRVEGGWLIVPLIHDEDVIGFVLLTNPRARINLNWENLDLLKTSGRQAASYIALYKMAEALAEAKQFEGFNRLSAFVVHDLKNLIAQLSLVVRNAERHRDNPEFIDDAIRTIDNAVKKMSALMAHLRSATPDDRRKRVELAGLVRSAVASKMGQRPVPILDNFEQEIWVHADPERLEAVIGHVIQNAQDATPDSGEVRVSLHVVEGEAVVEVRDTGSGMDQQFIRERLFKPFDSTKGLTGMGIGAYESREFVQASGGRVTVSSTPGKGTAFKILLPQADSLV